MSLEKAIKKNSELLKRQASDIKYRHDTWLIHAKPLVTKFFEDAIRQLSEHDYSFHPWISTDQLSSSEELIMLKLKPRVFASVKTPERRSMLYEEGCTLSCSKWHDGTLVFFVYPFKSEKHEMQQKEFMIAGPLDPMDVSTKQLEKYFKKFLFVANVSSLSIGMASRQPFLRFHLAWLTINDVRNNKRLTENLKRGVVRKSQAVIFAIITAFISGWLAKTYLG
ncbi:MAG: hypothetical protein KA296_04545 [Marinobacter sp.]|nr:hypothetical protein [Marinobacter sp.]